MCSLSLIGAERQATVIFGGSTYYAPFYYQDSKNELKGFDIASFKAVVAKAGWQAEFQLGDWDTIQEGLAVGHIDIVPIFISPGRADVAILDSTQKENGAGYQADRMLESQAYLLSGKAPQKTRCSYSKRY